MNQTLKEVAIGVGIGFAVAGIMIGVDILAQKVTDKIYFNEFSKKLEALFEITRINAESEQEFKVRRDFSRRLMGLRIKMALEMRDSDGEYKAIVDTRVDEFKAEMGWE